MNNRRKLIVALGSVALAAPFTSLAQQNNKIRRVGWLGYLGESDPGLALLRDGLRERGYIEGKSYVLVARFANGDFTRLPKLVDELAGENIEVLVSRGPSVDFTKTIRSRIPIVFAYSGDPIQAGFGDSLRKPGRNMTGITFMALELSAKRIEVLKELVPNATRIALLSNPEHSGELSEYRVTEDAARRFGATITRHLVRNPQELPATLSAISASNPDAMIVFPDSLTLDRRRQIAEFAAQAKIPCMYGWTEFADAGGLASYGPGVIESFKALAGLVDKVLKGVNAGDIPIEQVSKIGLTLNLVAAKALGIKIPNSVLVRADKVIE